MTLRVIDAGLSVAEVPITFTDRVAGHSKMSGSIVVEAMLRVTGWGIQRLFRRRRSPHLLTVATSCRDRGLGLEGSASRRGAAPR